MRARGSAPDCRTGFLPSVFGSWSGPQTLFVGVNHLIESFANLKVKVLFDVYAPSIVPNIGYYITLANIRVSASIDG
jgi:hypothetical protein